MNPAKQERIQTDEEAYHAARLLISYFCRKAGDDGHNKFAFSNKKPANGMERAYKAASDLWEAMVDLDKTGSIAAFSNKIMGFTT